MTNLTEIIPAADYARTAGEAKKRATSAKLHEQFVDQCRSRGLPEPRWKGHPDGELQFAKEALGRMWRFDACWEDLRVAAEIEGLVCTKLFDGHGKPHKVVMGRHATIGGFIEDCEKYNAAAFLGWTVLRFPQAQIKTGAAIETVRRVLFSRGWRPAKEIAPITVNVSADKPLKAGTVRKKKSAAAPKAPQSLGGSNKPSSPEASPLSHPVVEVAEAYAPGFSEDWIGAAAYIHDLMKHGVKLTQLVQAATQYRRQQAAQQAFDRQAGKPIKPAMKPSEFFGSEAWQGKFPMPVDPKVQEAEDETEMTNEAWLRSKFARA